MLDQEELQMRNCDDEGNWIDVDDSLCPSEIIVKLWESVSSMNVLQWIMYNEIIDSPCSLLF